MRAIKQCIRTDTNANTLPVCRSMTVTRYTRQGVSSCDLMILAEEPLSIRVQGKPYAVVMRTPGDEIPHVIGFCLGEGIIDAYEDIKQIACCEGTDTNVVTVTLNPARLLRAGSVLERRGYISQTSCGICGKEVVDDLIQTILPLQDHAPVHWQAIMGSLVHFSNRQTLYASTRASHAAVAFDADFRVLASGEDVGRHNAVDKAVGHLLIDGTLSDTLCLVLSSRISYELIQKAARARIPMVVGMSRPTALAVRLAERLNMTLTSIAEDQTLLVYSGAQRITHA